MKLVSPFEAGLGGVGRGVLEVLLPRRCPGCGDVLAPNQAHGLCGGCWSALSPIAEPLCHSCGVPFDYVIPGRKDCMACLAEPPPYDSARSAFRYDEGIRGLILGFKHADQTDLAPLLAGWLARLAPDRLVQADGLVPVPLHRTRLAKRRYNQSALLCKALSERSGVPDLTGLVVRTKPTPPQSGGPNRRKRNVQGAFALRPRRTALMARVLGPDLDPEEMVRDRALILIDDVMTTGATLSAVTKVLKRHGAARVDVLTLARV